MRKIAFYFLSTLVFISCVKNGTNQPQPKVLAKTATKDEKMAISKPEQQSRPKEQTPQKPMIQGPPVLAKVQEEPRAFWGYVAFFQPPPFFPSSSWKDMLAWVNQLGLPVGEMKAKLPTILFIWDPKTGPIYWKDWKKLPLALFLPLSLESKAITQLKENIRKILPESVISTDMIKEGIVLLMNHQVETLAKKDQSMMNPTWLIQTQDAYKNTSLFVHLEIDPILDALQLPIQGLILGDEQKIGATGKYLREKWSGSQLKEKLRKYQTPEVKSFLADALIVWLANYKSIELKTKMEAEKTQFQFSFQRKQEPTFEIKETKNLVQYLPASAMIRLQIPFDVVGELFAGEEGIPILPQFLAVPVEKEKPELSEKLEEVWNQFAQSSLGMTVAMAIDPSENNKLLAILAPKNSATWIKNCQEWVDIFRKLPSYQNKFSIILKPNTIFISSKNPESQDYSIEVLHKNNLIYIRMGSNLKGLEPLIKAVVTRQGTPLQSEENKNSPSVAMGEIQLKKALDFLFGERAQTELQKIPANESVLSWVSRREGTTESISFQLSQKVLYSFRSFIPGLK